jgi:hypothetical protein
LDAARVLFRPECDCGGKPYIPEINPLCGPPLAISHLGIQGEAAVISHSKLASVVPNRLCGKTALRG